MNSKERFALGSLLAVMAGGHLLRVTAFAPKDSPGGVTLLAGLAPADPALHRARSERLGRPLATGERIDLNRASAAEIARLPRVGMDLAKAIVRHREQAGRFESLDDLDEIDGIGPRLLAAIAPHVTPGDTGRSRRKGGEAPARAVWPSAPGAPNVVDTGGKRGRKAAGPKAPGVRISLNSASQADLEKLSGIGPTRAKAILAYRQANGPFASVQELEKVPGLPRRLVTQLAAQVMVP